MYSSCFAQKVDTMFRGVITGHLLQKIFNNQFKKWNMGPFNAKQCYHGDKYVVEDKIPANNKIPKIPGISNVHRLSTFNLEEIKFSKENVVRDENTESMRLDQFILSSFTVDV